MLDDKKKKILTIIPDKIKRNQRMILSNSIDLTSNDDHDKIHYQFERLI